ncbi:hypothetical protein CTI12_AA127380 [Artemisia annua]|uniref:Uncharacterized protein n=1 Tax=Artemisia annua TaxID=35608 RepID=A0A2U1PPM3_ARTAN|nr:hypothetical protein CTI12_AA127380 [Artemisia annua]
MAAIVNCFKQVWTSIVGAFTCCCCCCCGKTDEAPTTDTVEISTGPTGEVNIATQEISSGSGGKSNDNPLDLELKTDYGTSGQTQDLLATSMISSGGGGKSN